MLVLTLLLLGLGGLSADLWRAFSERRELAAVVDAAAVAGASALDEDRYRAADAVGLEAGTARRRAAAVLARHGDVVTNSQVETTTTSVVVVAQGEVPLYLARLLAPGADSLRIEVRATSEGQGGG